MTAQTSITAAELVVGDRLVWPGESAYNVAGDTVEPVLAVSWPADKTGSVEVVTRRNTTNRTRLLLAADPLQVLMPRPEGIES